MVPSEQLNRSDKGRAGAAVLGNGEKQTTMVIILLEWISLNLKTKASKQETKTCPLQNQNAQKECVAVGHLRNGWTVYGHPKPSWMGTLFVSFRIARERANRTMTATGFMSRLQTLTYGICKACLGSPSSVCSRIW
jgi:hypothetical protein